MAKEKVTLTLDADRLARLRAAVGGRSLSATVDAALAAHLDRLEHLAAVDDWLVELAAQDGPVTPEATAWAAAQFAAWEGADERPRRAG